MAEKLRANKAIAKTAEALIETVRECLTLDRLKAGRVQFENHPSGAGLEMEIEIRRDAGLNQKTLAYYWILSSGKINEHKIIFKPLNK